MSSPSPSVLIIIDTAFIGGPGKGVLQLARFLRERKIPYTIATFEYQNPKSTEFIDAVRREGLDLTLLPQKFSIDPSPFWILKKVITTRSISIIQTHGYKGHAFALPLARAFSIPWIGLTHGWTYENFKVKCYNALERFLLRFPDHVATVSPPLLQELQSIRRQGKTSLILNAVDDHHQNSEATEEIRQQYEIPEGVFLFLTAGRFSSEKGHRILLEAWARFSKFQTNSLLLLAGDGPDRTQLEAMVMQLGIRDTVKFLGYQKTLAPFYDLANAFILPSLSEGLPNVLLESIAAQLPFIGTTVGTIPDIVSDGHSGILCEPNNVDALAHALERFSRLTDAEKNDLAANAALDQLKNFGVTRRGEDFLALYSGVLDPAGKSHDGR